ncbi:hypothetical protein BJY01DRAFT_169823 [Aspergillus pseudoustus]|uniref:Uncharacterized protein n=1 Tax=Aspergillus pseudoustus TaxID=1810923 RepID=A0ABR4KWA2_9EURO
MRVACHGIPWIFELAFPVPMTSADMVNRRQLNEVIALKAGFGAIDQQVRINSAASTCWVSHKRRQCTSQRCQCSSLLQDKGEMSKPK